MTLDELISAVEGADGPLDAQTALELHVMGIGRLTEYAPITERDEYGGYTITYQVDTFGGGRQKATMREDDLPDRSVDAALGLVERVLPGWEWTVSFVASDATAGVSPPVSVPWTRAVAATPALAIILATLRALKHKEAGR